MAISAAGMLPSDCAAVGQKQPANVTFRFMEPNQFPAEDFFAHLVKWVRAGGDVQRYRTKAGWTLLHLAAEFCDTEAIRYLLKLGVDPEDRDHNNGWTALHLAVDAEFDSQAQTGRPTELSAVRALVGSGADILARASSGQTPRDIAALYGKDALVQYDRIVP
jgi:hypothetical protein